MTHELKILPKWFDDVASKKKKFEIRRYDRMYDVGDKLILKEWDRRHYTGRQVEREIEYIYFGDGTYWLPEDFCILGIKEVENEM